MSSIELPVADAPAVSGPRARPAAENAAPARQVADPGPLGLAAFALTTFVLSAFNAGIVADKTLEAVVLPLALFYGGGVQLLAGMWEFAKNNTFGAVAFTSYGAFWLSFAAYFRYILPDLPPAGAHQATGLFLLAWAIFTAYMTVISARVSGIVFAVFACLSVTFVLLTAGTLAQLPSVAALGGWTGLTTALLAWYGSFAGVANATWKHRTVPTWPAAG